MFNKEIQDVCFDLGGDERATYDVFLDVMSDEPR